MTLPDRVREGVERLLEGKGISDPRIARSSPVGGGCINPSARLELASGEMFFLKWNAGADPGFFRAEAEGLEALRSAAGGLSLRVPQVIGVEDPGNPPWLLLEFIPQGKGGAEYWQALGSGLAAIHGAGTSEGADASEGTGTYKGAATFIEMANPRGADLRPPRGTFGWSGSNFIGSLPQSNRPDTSWGAFWRDQRLEPQLRRAKDAGHFRGGDAQVFDALLARCQELLDPVQEDGPSLLHGDLWGGNVYPDPDGNPVLIDPSVYRGHREVDLAMSELFGGFSRRFYGAYEEARPLLPGYENLRRDLYQLYYLLVHVNLFGGSYAAGSMAAAQRVLRNA